MSRSVARVSQAIIDVMVLAAAFSLAFFMRFDWVPPKSMVGRWLLVLPYVVLFEYAVLRLVGTHRYSWRYVGLRETLRFLLAAAIWTTGLVAARLVLGELQYEYAYLRHGVIPLGALAANFLLSFTGVVGVRAARRIIGERIEAKRNRPEGSGSPQGAPAKTLLVGAGQAGFMVARELRLRPETGMDPVGFLDDDTTKVGTIIDGISVLGTTADLESLAARHEVTDVLITMANVPGSTVRRIRQQCERAGLKAKIIPGLYEIVGGRVNLSRIRDISLEDLLGRDPVVLDLDAISAFIGDRTVLVSGAGGSIGAELCRQVAAFGPRTLVLVERAEPALFAIHRELGQAYPELDLRPCIADVTDPERIDELFARHRPSVAFHAAAHKHVPMMEANPGEAIKNNVFGSKVMADAAHGHGAEAFVMVSTDKAVNPTSVMGATKRVAELYVQSVAEQSATRFVTVRFGNVLGSTGSVVPIFQEQIRRGGPVTVTHPEMQRYFMTIPEASQLILQAGTIGESGEILVLDMGKPVKIVDLARDLISLSGVSPGEVDVEFTGIRPGEKLFEELATDDEHADRTKHPKIFIGRTQRMDVDRVRGMIDDLKGCLAADCTVVRSELARLVPEMQVPATDDDSLPESVRPLDVGPVGEPLALE